MSTETVFPEVEFEALLEAWEQFLVALVGVEDEGAMECAVNREGAARPDAPPVFIQH